MHHCCQDTKLKLLKNLLLKSHHLRQTKTAMSEQSGEKSQEKHRERKQSESSSSSDNDGAEGEADGTATSSDYTKPTSDKNKFQLNCIQRFFAQKLGLYHDEEDNDHEKTSTSDSKILKTLDFQGLVDHWKNNGFKKIVTMVGAGISTSAGIPDFRSPTTGLYHNLQKYKLPYPTAIFEIDYFERNPQPFFALAKELYPGNFKPTPCHYFIKLLHDKGLLLRHYTQNIDTLERIAGIPSEKLVEAHGTFYTNHCLDCRREYSMEWVKEKIFADNVPTCVQCNGIIKPDIIFFGEDLPRKFYILPEKDFEECDLLIIMGTSLEVQPFASLVGRPNQKCVRLLINRDPVGQSSGFNSFFACDMLRYGKKNNKRDVAWLGDCDKGVLQLAKDVGLEDELKLLIEREHKKIDELANSEAQTINSEAEKKNDEQHA